MLLDEGKFIYKTQEGKTIEALVLDMHWFCGDIEVYTLEENERYINYYYDTENDKWFKYKKYDGITEPFEEEVIDFWFTTRLAKDENK